MHNLFEGICGHRKTDQAREDVGVPIRTTKGWEILLQWKNGEVTWVPMKDVKNSNPIELAEYVANNGLENELAFKWWVPRTLKKSCTFNGK